MTKADDIRGILTPGEVDACRKVAEMRCSPLIRDLVHAVAEASGVKASDIYARNKTSVICRARWVVMLAAYDRGATISGIGRALGLDHTTVMHGIKKAREAESPGTL